MVQKVRNFFNKEIQGLHEAAYLLASFAFLSQILALVRDRLFASSFGASDILDVYYAAFRIPDIIFVVVSSLVSVSVLVPFLVKRQTESQKSAEQFVNSIFTLLLIIASVFIILALIFTGPLLKLIVPDLLSRSHGTELILITRLLLLQPLLLSLSSLFSSIVQVYRKFFIYAVSPVVYNLGIIFGVVFLYPSFGLQGIVYGVVLGAFLHLAVQMPAVKDLSLIPKLTFSIDWKSIKSVLILSLPRTITLMNTHIILLLFLALAGTMVAGSISIFSLAYNLQSVPLSIIGVSYSIAAFPTLSRLYSNGHTAEFLAHVVRAARHIIFWSFPIMILFVVLRAQIVRVIFGSGSFDWNDTRLTAASLAFFAISICAQSLILLFVRGYYSAGQTKKPLLISFVSLSISIISAFYLVQLFESKIAFQFFIERLMRVENIPGSIVLMLPLAYTIGQLVNVILLWMLFDKQFKTFSDTLWRPMIHSLGASLVMGYVSFIFLQILDDIFNLNKFWGIFSQGLIAGIFGIAAGCLVLILLDNHEIKIVWQTLHRKIWKAKLVAAEPDEV